MAGVSDVPWFDAVDRRPVAAELPWPPLAGKRCLDIGTADGFWALEMERRGAADVVATDVGTPFARHARARIDAVESSVRYEECSVYDLEGEYDLAFMGWVLQTLDDPIRALKAVRRVAKQLLVLDTVSVPLLLIPAPLARLDARRDGGECFVFNPRGLRKALELAGWRVDAQTGILRERYMPPGGWKHRLGIRGRSCAMLGS
jgi:tRNA (mo5U34)-methyltransferase